MIWAFVAVLCSVPVGVFLLRPRVAGLFRADFQGIKIESILGPIITLTVFVGAFVIAQATQTYQRAGQDAIAEASAVSLLHDNAGLLPDDRGKDLQAASVCYARAVRHLEWPAMTRGKSAPEVDHWAGRFDALIPEVLDGPGPIVGQVVGLNRTQTEARQLRLYEASPHLPQLTIILVIMSVIFVMLLLTSLAAADIRRRVLFTLSMALAVLLGGTLYLIEQLEEPFSGVIHLQPALITKVEARIAADFAARYPDVSLPCDIEGHPTN